MDLHFTAAEDAFRLELRAWLVDNEPDPEPAGGEPANFAWRRDFQRRLHEGGWTGIDWPREHGGRGGTLAESAIFYEELSHARHPCPPTRSASCSAAPP